MIPIYHIQIRWLTRQEGGRSTPILGDGRYTPTARFAGEEDQFSVVLEFPNEPNRTQAALRLLCPDLVGIQQRLHPGISLEIMEGPRVVAQCVVQSSDVGAVATAAR
jgi:hypothetical protein